MESLISRLNLGCPVVMSGGLKWSLKDLDVEDGRVITKRGRGCSVGDACPFCTKTIETYNRIYSDSGAFELFMMTAMKELVEEVRRLREIVDEIVDKQTSNQPK